MLAIGTEYGLNTSVVRWEYGTNTMRLRRDYGGNTKTIRTHYEDNTMAIRRRGIHSLSKPGRGLGENTMFLVLRRWGERCKFGERYLRLNFSGRLRLGIGED